ncbi:ErfK/YbiS/YcfS/YnhG family protein [Desulfonatronospira thiodismutans ASO3-1]|uniref:ErfK/YbiS/YcfS/YnhG family protein n=2 Tax=Desulfonatronospira thiodismutans TaxID=488939 RepID=D6STG0_9BACT|nr:ErfK/YbiS/YcfS/YnhG family protein [Desulfonatronospira thiodismutans ASO3-1]
MRTILFLLLILTWSLPAMAWEPLITGDSRAPEDLFVVDKKNQTFFVFSNKSPLRKEYKWEVTTGEGVGDKEVEGDLKTPEGIYFIERQIDTRHLDRDLYGEMGLTLNYPNPVDRAKGKTGFGIWLHGRGKEVVPFDTEGCVAMDMKYMHRLEDMVQLQNTPVVITSTMSWEEDEIELEKSRKIADLSLDWAAAWSDGTGEYFEFYLPDRFARSSGKSFSSFKNHKQGLFNTYDWMDVYIEQPKVLAGPDYWVSYFGQVFNSSGFFSSGVKRLYWQKDEAGDLRIVGEEFRNYNKPGLKDSYIKDRGQRLKQVVEKWRQAWLEADVDKYASFYHPDAVQGNVRGLDSILKDKKDLWERGNEPAEIEISDIEAHVGRDGFEVRFKQEYASRSGYSDKGIKTLQFVPGSGDSWLILREDWRETG